VSSLYSGGFHHFKWVVYDEIHSLNEQEVDHAIQYAMQYAMMIVADMKFLNSYIHVQGPALQRLIRMLKTKFLALSATVGNAEELRSWFEHVRGEQLDAQVNCNTTQFTQYARA
jgi:replicative superfamily II helicase